MTNYLKLLLLTLLVLTSCRSSKEVLYMQDIGAKCEQLLENGYEVIIHKDDLLSVMVNSRDPELALPFNMPTVSYQLGNSYSQQRILGYLVDANGNIDFPILGQIHVEGLTRMQLKKLVKQRLIEGDYIKDPVVTVQFQNFKVSVIGEVARPGSFNISGDRVTLLEALSMAGDLSIYGRRDRVAVIREMEGKRVVTFLDLRNSSIFDSPYYYLQQNDIVYVEPNKAKAQMSGINSNNSVGVWLSASSILVSVTSLIINLAK